MTDEDVIDSALSAVDAGLSDHSLMRRNGRAFIVLPARASAAIHALWLYQPQRIKARLAVSAMQFLVLSGLYRMVLPAFRGGGGKVALDPEYSGCRPGTVGVMLGSPEHRVRRAILSYETESGYEVAKLAFGAEGKEVIEGEASALRGLAAGMPGVPRLLGVHQGPGYALLRMPYEKGTPFSPRRVPEAVRLLESWLSDSNPVSVDSFPEWNQIAIALGKSGNSRLVRDLSGQKLVPALRHGDFARWNLRRTGDGSVVVLDWEWGHAAGMPGLDLAHFFLQDGRLVRKRSPKCAVAEACRMMRLEICQRYLGRAGWRGDPLLPLVASLAWKQAAGHQDNEEVLAAALGFVG